SKFRAGRDAAWLDRRMQIRESRRLLCDGKVRLKWSLQNSVSRKRKSRPRDSPSEVRLMAGYSGTPLSKKLGLKPDALLALLSAPASLLASLAPMPEGVRVASELGAETYDVILLIHQLPRHPGGGVRQGCGTTPDVGRALGRVAQAGVGRPHRPDR